MDDLLLPALLAATGLFAGLAAHPATGPLARRALLLGLLPVAAALAASLLVVGIAFSLAAATCQWVSRRLWRATVGIMRGYSRLVGAPDTLMDDDEVVS